MKTKPKFNRNRESPLSKRRAGDGLRKPFSANPQLKNGRRAPRVPAECKLAIFAIASQTAPYDSLAFEFGNEIHAGQGAPTGVEAQIVKKSRLGIRPAVPAHAAGDDVERPLVERKCIERANPWIWSYFKDR